MRERIQEVVAKRWVLPAVSGVVGLGVGFAVGYMRTKSQYDRIESKMDEIQKESNQLEFDFSGSETEAILRGTIDRMDQTISLMEEQLEADRKRIAAMQEHPSIHEYNRMNIENTEALVEKRATADRPVRLVPKLVEEVVPVARNVFDNAGDEWDYKVELENRDTSQPYVIHVDEFMADEKGWESQSTLTWYEGDSVLCDEHDKPIYNHSEVVGELRFGHGSNDANVVYIRNEKLQSEFEVLRDTDSYEQVVLGQQMEIMDLKHSQSLRKFRDD